MVDRPNSSYDLKKTIENLKRFNGELIIQTIFLKGRTQGKEIDNTTEEFIVPWISALKEIQPKEVMIYTLARETPAPDLEKIPKEKMDEIGQRLKNEGFRVSVSY